MVVAVNLFKLDKKIGVNTSFTPCCENVQSGQTAQLLGLTGLSLV